MEKIKTSISSEFGKLEAVIIHQPGPEVENMTPINAERALYSDILNLSIASVEYGQLLKVLGKVTRTIEIQDLLIEILNMDDVRKNLITSICRSENVAEAVDFLRRQPPEQLSAYLIEGVPLKKNTLTRFLSEEKFLLRPLHNLFFPRDAAMGMFENIIIGRMANIVRERETIIMDAIFRHHPMFSTKVVGTGETEPLMRQTGRATIEGGDFLVARSDILIIGNGIRTTTQGIDLIIDFLRSDPTRPVNLIIQELPPAPESFIHLDMVFNLLDQETCLAYSPLIIETNRYRTILIRIDGGKVTRIREAENIPSALRKLGLDMKIVYCGGKDDLWVQEREQWHSGANFLAFSPGKLIGYKRNTYTLDELSRNGFEIIEAEKIIHDEVSVVNYRKCVITVSGSELARGGGGARCMTMPVRRSNVDW